MNVPCAVGNFSTVDTCTYLLSVKYLYCIIQSFFMSCWQPIKKFQSYTKRVGRNCFRMQYWCRMKTPMLGMDGNDTRFMWTGKKSGQRNHGTLTHQSICSNSLSRSGSICEVEPAVAAILHTFSCKVNSLVSFSTSFLISTMFFLWCGPLLPWTRSAHSASSSACLRWSFVSTHCNAASEPRSFGSSRGKLLILDEVASIAVSKSKSSSITSILGRKQSWNDEFVKMIILRGFFLCTSVALCSLANYFFRLKQKELLPEDFPLLVHPHPHLLTEADPKWKQKVHKLQANTTRKRNQFRLCR